MRVAGRIVTLGEQVEPEQEIVLDVRARQNLSQQVTLLLHKPVGYVSGQPEKGYRPAAVLLRPENRWHQCTEPPFMQAHVRGLAPAGRLDIDSQGLLVFTQDGRLARQLIGTHEIEKEYLVRVTGPLDTAQLALLRHGLSLDGRPLLPAGVEWQNEDQLRFVLREGRKRQIRRMCHEVGLTVAGLKRVRIGSIRLGALPAGQWRYLRADEHF